MAEHVYRVRRRRVRRTCEWDATREPELPSNRSLLVGLAFIVAGLLLVFVLSAPGAAGFGSIQPSIQVVDGRPRAAAVGLNFRAFHLGGMSTSSGGEALEIAPGPVVLRCDLPEGHGLGWWIGFVK